MTTRVELMQYCLSPQSGLWKQAGDCTSYQICETKDEIILAFEGSNEKKDWYFNVDFVVQPYKNMKNLWFAHRGFVSAWAKSRDQISEEVLYEIERTGKPLVITGYSHGASVSILAHEYFNFESVNPITHAFGPSRVLWLPNKKIRERFSSCFVYGTAGDLVTHLPPAFFGYRHTSMIRMGQKHRISTLPHYPEYYLKCLEALE